MLLLVALLHKDSKHCGQVEPLRDLGNSSREPQDKLFTATSPQQQTVYPDIKGKIFKGRSAKFLEFIKIVVISHQTRPKARPGG